MTIKTVIPPRLDSEGRLVYATWQHSFEWPATGWHKATSVAFEGRVFRHRHQARNRVRIDINGYGELPAEFPDPMAALSALDEVGRKARARLGQNPLRVFVSAWCEHTGMVDNRGGVKGLNRKGSAAPLEDLR